MGLFFVVVYVSPYLHLVGPVAVAERSMDASASCNKSELEGNHTVHFPSHLCCPPVSSSRAWPSHSTCPLMNLRLGPSSLMNSIQVNLDGSPVGDISSDYSFTR